MEEVMSWKSINKLTDEKLNEVEEETAGRGIILWWVNVSWRSLSRFELFLIHQLYEMRHET
jgi:hypothetical protein